MRIFQEICIDSFAMEAEGETGVRRAWNRWSTRYPSFVFLDALG
jgi:hypothetical protein